MRHSHRLLLSSQREQVARPAHLIISYCGLLCREHLTALLKLLARFLY